MTSAAESDGWPKARAGACSENFLLVACFQSPPTKFHRALRDASCRCNASARARQATKQIVCLLAAPASTPQVEKVLDSAQRTGLNVIRTWRAPCSQLLLPCASQRPCATPPARRWRGALLLQLAAADSSCYSASNCHPRTPQFTPPGPPRPPPLALPPPLTVIPPLSPLPCLAPLLSGPSTTAPPAPTPSSPPPGSSTRTPSGRSTAWSPRPAPAASARCWPWATTGTTSAASPCT